MIPNADTNNVEPGADRSERPSDTDHTEKSIQKIAVLFTDIIGSTRFFKSHGNLAGRKMLQQHENIVSKTITRFGGTVVKNLGDSILAYFADPQEATKTAVQIQKEFREYNKQTIPKHKINVRIGVHFDEGIVEDTDIFGNAVNIASKITHLAGSNQIFISQDVLALVDTLPSLQFEPVAIPDQDDSSSEPALYRVVWEESIDFAPATVLILYMRPVRRPGVDTVWKDLIEAGGLFWDSRIDQEAIKEDQLIILTAKKLSVIMDVIGDVIAFLKGHLKASSAIPVQIIVDAGPSRGIDRLVREGFKPEWEELRPGTISMSPSAYRFLEEEGLSIAESPPGEDQRRQSFYEIAPDDYQQKEDEVLFPHQDLLFQGNNPPCFYCGSREHMAHNCPSKQLTGITTTLQKLGYLSFERISNIFHSYLMNPEGVKRQEILLQAESRDQEASPGLGLYELRQIFQLRFFRNIWDSYSNDWDKVARSNNQENSTGELIWLAQDCIRVSNLPRAESLLQTCLEEYPDDYRTYCTLGFLNIERGSYSRSEQHLEAALRYARTVPQKIFLLFLLSRRYDLADDFDDALKRIREIKLMQPYCPEATYQEIILNFKQGGDQDTALGRLMSLIRMNREYYINALIDPELAPFNSMIHPQLKKLFTEIRRKAQKKAYDAQKEFFSLEQFLTEEDPEMEKAGALLSKIQDLIPTDSYFGYMDIVDLGNSVVSICRRAKSRRKEEFMNAVQEINNRLGTILSVSASYRSHLSPSARQQLRTIQSSFKQIREAATFNDFKKFKEMSVQSAEIIKELSSIALEIRRVKRILEIKTFLLLFLKNTAFILSVILFAGIFILPTIVYYLSTFSPGFDAFTGSDIRSYHKQVLIFGILGGLALAFLKSFKAFFKDKT